MEETIKLIVSVLAVLISVASLGVALWANHRSRRAEDIRVLLGEKESVAFGALKLLRDGLPSGPKHRKLVVAAIMQACVFERSDRARALLYRVIEENLATFKAEFREALHVVEDTFEQMSQYKFSLEELNLGNGLKRIDTVRKVLGLPQKPRDPVAPAK